MRARWTVTGTLAAVACLLALSVSAQEVEELHPADRFLVHGYSPEAMQLFWDRVSGDDAATACGITEGTEYTYDVDEEGNVTLSEEGTEVVPGDAEDCSLTATDVTGPQGQVNHGTVVSSFVHDLKDSLREAGYTGGLGCYVRVIAGSDYGKGDQQVKVSDVEENVEPSTEDPTVELTITETTCGDDDETETETSGESGKPEWVGNGPPPWAGKPGGNGNGGPPAHAKGKNK